MRLCVCLDIQKRILILVFVKWLLKIYGSMILTQDHQELLWSSASPVFSMNIGRLIALIHWINCIWGIRELKTISHTDLEPEFKTEECEIKFTRWPQSQMSFADKFSLYILYEVLTIDWIRCYSLTHCGKNYTSWLQRY